MSKSFFTGTDGELYSGSKNFSDRINLSPEVYGLSSELAAAYEALNAVWCEAYEASQNPGTRSRSIVAAKNQAKRDIRKMASSLERIISGTPTVTNEQRITLGLSVRSAPAPIGQPGKASDFSVWLDGNGALRLKWKCKHPKGARGTLYRVSRSVVGSSGPFDFLGETGEKTFYDDTLPTRLATVTYEVQAVRTTGAGPTALFNVSFGTDGKAPRSYVPKGQQTQIAA